MTRRHRAPDPVLAGTRAAALAQARRYFQDVQHKMTAEAGHDRLWPTYVKLAQGTLPLQLDVIGLARAGNADADDVIRDRVQELRNNKMTVPVVLEAYALEREMEGWRRRPGVQIATHFQRNFGILYVLQFLALDFPMLPIKTCGARREASICVIIAEAVSELKVFGRVTGGTVVDVRRRYLRATQAVALFSAAPDDLGTAIEAETEARKALGFRFKYGSRL